MRIFPKTGRARKAARVYVAAVPKAKPEVEVPNPHPAEPRADQPVTSPPKERTVTRPWTEKKQKRL